MRQVLGSMVIGIVSLTFGGLAVAQTVSDRTNGGSESASAEPSPPTDAQCSSAVLESYARRRAFTQRLIEQREQQRFEEDVDHYVRRRAFTEQLMRQREPLAEADRTQFDEQVGRYTRLREFTLRLQDERDLREALAFARDFALQERKWAFTRKLIERSD
jgi:hypothetical protein